MIRQVLGVLTSRFLLVVGGLILSVVTARFLGASGRGEFFYWSTLAALAVQFGNCGLHSSNTYFLAKGRASLSTLEANSRAVSLSAGLLLSAGLVIFILAQGYEISANSVFLISVFMLVPSSLYFLLGSNLLIGLSRIFEYNVFEVLNRYVGLSLMLLSLLFWRTPEALFAAFSIASVIVCLPLYFRLRKIGFGELWQIDLNILKSGFGYAFRAYLGAVLSFVVLRINAVLLERLTDISVLGAWSVAAQLLDTMNMIPAAIALVLLPRVLKSTNPYRMMSVSFAATIPILIVISLVLFAFGHELIHFLYGSEFLSAYQMLIWGLPSAVSLGLIGIVSQYLAAVGIPVLLLWAWFAGVLLELAASIWLIPLHGGVGAMMALSLSHITVLLLLIILAVTLGNSNSHKA